MKSLYTQPYTSWTHQLARIMVRPLLGSAITPNHLTTARLLAGLAASIAFAFGTQDWIVWGGVLWLLSCLLDRADGELARLGGLSSPGGHLYDYYCDVIVNGVVFAAIGWGLRNGSLGLWAPILGVLAGAAVALASVLSEGLENAGAIDGKAYAGILGFDFDDALYLLAPIAWLGGLPLILIGAAIIGPIMAAITAWRCARQRLWRTQPTARS
jgi:phosphatidylglycerophosphate synthase